MVNLQGMETRPAKADWLDRRVIRGFKLSAILLALIVVLAAWLRFVNLEVVGDGNTYYTAAVESMLQSWKNFFYVAAEPGGSVSVDKPPLGLWLQAISAFFLGVNGFAVMLPQILAGILAVPVLYLLVKRYFGTAAGLAAALILAVTPVVVAVDRNNTMDSTLVLTLLLAAWAFMKGTDEGRLRWLLLGGLLVGLGFNIKMLQAFLPLPAFYGLYLLGSRQPWGTKAINLGLTTIVLVAVSLSWAIAVDLTPADERPYVGSSEDNTVMELILGHNGLNRLFGGGGGTQQAPSDGSNDDRRPLNPPLSDANPQAGSPVGVNGPPPGPGNGPPLMGGQVDGAPQSGNQPAGGPDGGGTGNGEIGQPGILRLFTQPLSNEIAWLLPLACLSLLVLALGQRLRWPLGPVHKGWLLWGGWFLTAALFFSVAEFYHAYYLTMMAAPLAAVVSAGMMLLGRRLREGSALAGLVLATGVVVSVLYQGYVGSNYVATIVWLIPAVGLMLSALLAWAAILSLGKAHWVGLALSLSMASVVVVPGIWSTQTALDDSPNVNLPQAYEDHGDEAGNRRMAVNDKLLEFLLDHTTDTEYLMAVRSSMEGTSYVLETGRPVLYMGGFNGGDPVVSAADLEAMVAEGELRFILWTVAGRGGSTSLEIESWLRESCRPVTGLGLGVTGAAARPRPDGDGPPAATAAGAGVLLYQCE